MKVTTFDSATCVAIRETMQEVLGAAMTERHSLDTKVGHIRYDTHSATIKVTVSVVDDDGTIHTPEADEYNRRAGYLELPPLGSPFVHRGERYTIEGYRSRARKRPIIGRRGDGKEFVFPVALVKLATNSTD